MKPEFLDNDSEDEGIEDYNMWLRLNYEGKTFYNISEVLTYHRVHFFSAFNTKKYNLDEIRNKWRF